MSADTAPLTAADLVADHRYPGDPLGYSVHLNAVAATAGTGATAGTTSQVLATSYFWAGGWPLWT